MSDLLPCPFCGGSVSLHKGIQSFDDYEVQCDGCGVCGPNFGSMDETFTPKQDAIAAWNRRAIPATDAREAAQAQARAAWRIAGMVTNNDEALRVHEAICALFNIGTEPPEGIDEART